MFRLPSVLGCASSKIVDLQYVILVLRFLHVIRLYLYLSVFLQDVRSDLVSALASFSLTKQQARGASSLPYISYASLLRYSTCV